MNWGDGKYGKGFHGACVYLEPISDGYCVQAQVLIGRNNGMSLDCGELGRVKEDAEAVSKWGKITWRPDGLYIGTGGVDDFFLPRQKLEAHR